MTQFSPQQDDALSQVAKWLDQARAGSRADQVFRLFGYAGTGKTTLARHIAEAIDGTASRFDVFARLPVPAFPGGTLLRWPTLVLAMTWFALRDRLGV